MSGRALAATEDGDSAPHSLLPLVADACGDGWTVDLSGDGVWIRARHERSVERVQGWKLHVSAGLVSAEEVLRQALPVLLAETAPFKVVESLDLLGAINGAPGFAPSQIGKFITVYPSDDEEAVHLATALDDATRGLRGPAVPSDRRLRPDSLVHYRYGGFGDLHVQTPLGQIVPAIRNPEGALVPDLRVARYSPPDWVEDPFAAAGVAGEPPKAELLVAGRYVVVGNLHGSARGAIQLAVDTESPRRVVLKRARRDAHLDRAGRDARDRLRRERQVLGRLAGDDRFPAVFDLVEQDGDLHLAMEDVEGETVEAVVMELALRGRHPTAATIVGWGRALASALGAIHASGFVYRDLKSPNVIVAPDGSLRLIDFELAHELGSTEEPVGHGTRGFTSPQQAAREPPAVTDDVYGLGALLYFVATGADPSHAPKAFSLLSRPIELMNPGIPASLARVVARCLAGDPAERFASMAELDAALAVVEVEPPPSAPPFGAPAPGGSDADSERHRTLSSRLADTLCDLATSPLGEAGLAWFSTHPLGTGFLSRTINTGSAGVVIALATLACELGDDRHRMVVAEGAHWLSGAPPPSGEAVPGLYVGEAGVAAALLRAGQVLGDEGLLESAAERGRSIAALPHASPDLFNGTAGRLRFHLMLWDETGAEEALAPATACGERLLATAERPGRGRLCWRIPPGYASLSGSACLGYSHGAAGIADTLLDLYEVTADDRYLVAARGAARWLQGLAVPVLEDGSGLDWPTVEGGRVFGALWCHGAAGIGRFFIRAADLDLLPEASDIAARAARAVAHGARWAGPVQCHGLAGNIEVLLDQYQATGDTAYLNEARALARILEAFGEERDGNVVWPSESPFVTSPDFMVGYAGVATCFLRLSDPSLPHALSRAGFRRKPRQGPSGAGRVDAARA